MTNKDTISNGNYKERIYGHLSDQILCELCMSLDSKCFPNKAARLEKKNVKAEMKERNIVFVDFKMLGVFHKNTGGEITKIEAGSVCH